MKYLILCEGPNELEIINILLENDFLIFNEDDLLGLQPYHARQIDKSAIVQNELNIYTGNDLIIIRIGDKQNDTLRIPKKYKEKFLGEQKKYCTKPELEILLIISEGLWSQFEKVKSKIKPKDFAKQKIKLNGKNYDNSSKFYKDYYRKSPQKLTEALIIYKSKNGSHQKDELYLADLLK